MSDMPIECGSTCLETRFPPLRQEIIESEKTRSDLFKYKLIGTAALATVALGLSGTTPNSPTINPAYILCIIPIFASYIDILAWHLNVRIRVIGEFLRVSRDPYEWFVGRLVEKRNIFSLEDWILYLSTWLLSLLLLIFWGVTTVGKSGREALLQLPYLVFGLAGLILSVVTLLIYWKRCAQLLAAAKEIEQKRRP